MQLFLLTTEESGGFSIGTIIMFGAMILIFYFLLIRPQRKRDKETQNMRGNIEIGDGVTTIGGIVGRVVSVKDDTLLIETGSDRNKLRIQRWAVQEVEKLELESASTEDTSK